MNLGSGETSTLVGIGEWAISSDPSALLVAPHLGSCLGIAVYDPVNKVAGLVHCLLPLSSADPERAKGHPCMYVDTGLIFILQKLLTLGASKKSLIIKVAGGSAISDSNGYFEIGKRNQTALRKILWKNDLLIAAEDVGGSHPRTVTISVASGRVSVRSEFGEKELKH